jgi:hypothetical protein
MRWHVRGAWRHSGAIETVAIDAPTEQQASELAEQRGMDVHAVETEPEETATSVPDFDTLNLLSGTSVVLGLSFAIIGLFASLAGLLDDDPRREGVLAVGLFLLLGGLLLGTVGAIGGAVRDYIRHRLQNDLTTDAASGSQTQRRVD